jgi:hypothetical protein
VLADYRWCDRAACVGLDWWPSPGRTPADDEPWALAVEVCERCSARRACAALALSTWWEISGVWAGEQISSDPTRRRSQRAALARLAGIELPPAAPVQHRLPL